MAIVWLNLIIIASALLLWSAAACDRIIVRPSFFSPVVFTTLLFILSYVWRPLLHLTDPDRYSAYPEALASFMPETILWLMAASIVGIFTFHIGYRSSLGPASARSIPDLEWRDWRFSIVLFIIILVVTGIILRDFLSNVGAIGAFNMAVRQDVMSNFKGNGPSLFFLFNMATFASFCALIYLTIRSSSHWSARYIYVLIGVIFYAGALFFTVLTGSRAPLISVLLIPILLRHYFVKPISSGIQASVMMFLLIGAGVVGLLMVSPTASAAGVGPEINVMSVVARLSGTLDQFELLYIAVTQSNTYLLGLSYLQDITLTYVPRFVFPDKPEVFGTVLLQNILIPSRFESVSLSATYPVGFFAEAYMNFGLAGFIIAPFFYGVFLRALAEKALGGPTPYAFLLLVSLSGTVSVLRSAGGQLASLIFLFAIVLLFARVRRAKPLAHSTSG